MLWVGSTEISPSLDDLVAASHTLFRLFWLNETKSLRILCGIIEPRVYSEIGFRGLFASTVVSVLVVEAFAGEALFLKRLFLKRLFLKRLFLKRLFLNRLFLKLVSCI